MMDQLYLDLAGAMINNITLSIIEPLKTTARTIRWEKVSHICPIINDKGLA